MESAARQLGSEPLFLRGYGERGEAVGRAPAAS
jgi:hypothetical protein